MKIELNQDSCIGSGSCEMLAPAVFGVSDDGYVHLVDGVDADNVSEDFRTVVQAAASACPTNVISVV